MDSNSSPDARACLSRGSGNRSPLSADMYGSCFRVRSALRSVGLQAVNEAALPFAICRLRPVYTRATILFVKWNSTGDANTPKKWVLSSSFFFQKPPHEISRHVIAGCDNIVISPPRKRMRFFSLFVCFLGSCYSVSWNPQFHDDGRTSCGY